MADSPNDYRDPKVTTTKTDSGGIGKWIAIALAVLLALALLGWLLGWFGDDDVDAVVTPSGNVVKTD